LLWRPAIALLLTTSAEGNAFPKEGYGNNFSFPKIRVHVNFRASTGVRKFGAGHGIQDHALVFGRHGNKYFRPAGMKI
jgi:hypothetical protein